MNVQTLPTVVCVSADSLGSLRGELERDEFRVFELHGSHIHDKVTFFEEAARSLPHPDNLVARRSWDALADILWEGFASAGCPRTAILWTDADQMLERGLLPELLTASQCFDDIASQLLSVNPPVMLRTFLVGVGENFPALEEARW